MCTRDGSMDKIIRGKRAGKLCCLCWGLFSANPIRWTEGNKGNVIEYRIVMKNKSSEWLDDIELGFDSISLKCLKNMKTVYQDENNVVLFENSVE